MSEATASVPASGARTSSSSRSQPALPSYRRANQRPQGGVRPRRRARHGGDPRDRGTAGSPRSTPSATPSSCPGSASRPSSAADRTDSVHERRPATSAVRSSAQSGCATARSAARSIWATASGRRTRSPAGARTDSRDERQPSASRRRRPGCRRGSLQSAVGRPDVLQVVALMPRLH